jgi:hypothetical protein
VVALIGFAAIFSVVYAFGRLYIPTFGPTPLAAVLATQGEANQSADSRLLHGLHADLLTLPGSAAVVEASGAISQRFVLVNLDSFGLLLGEGLPTVDSPIDLKLNLSGEGATLSVVSKGVVLGGPQQVARMTVVFSTGGKTFYPPADNCVLELLESELLIREVGDGQMWLPDYLGQVSCTDVPEIRTGELVDFTAVFRYVPQV